MKKQKVIANKRFSVEQLNEEIRAAYGEKVLSISLYDALNETEEDTEVIVELADDADESLLEGIVTNHFPTATLEEEEEKQERQLANERMRLAAKSDAFKDLVSRLESLEGRVTAVEG